MKTGKITAKLRDAVPVCLMVNGEEVKRYKNIKLPDMLKEVEMTDFHFNVHTDGKITFEIHYEEAHWKALSLITGGFVSMLVLDAVRKNLTIPSWLNTFAENNHINFSQVL